LQKNNNMKFLFIVLISFFSFSKIQAQTKTVHVFVALCDNINQGIVPVPANLGNGQDPTSNLYWGALYGIKTYFKSKAPEWTYVKLIPSEDTLVLERVLFKHKTKDIYMLADAYNGKYIKECTEEFLKASNGQRAQIITFNGKSITFGGKSDLVCYIGHDGLMNFDVNVSFNSNTENKIETIILACYSRDYFQHLIKKANAKPLLWTTHLMAPEAYTLEAALEGWVNRETDLQIEERAAQAYNKYQKCGIKGARYLFTTGFKN